MLGYMQVVLRLVQQVGDSMHPCTMGSATLCLDMKVVLRFLIDTYSFEAPRWSSFQYRRTYVRLAVSPSTSGLLCAMLYLPEPRDLYALCCISKYLGTFVRLAVSHSTADQFVRLAITLWNSLVDPVRVRWCGTRGFGFKSRANA